MVTVSDTARGVLIVNENTSWVGAAVNATCRSIRDPGRSFDRRAGEALNVSRTRLPTVSEAAKVTSGELRRFATGLVVTPVAMVILQAWSSYDPVKVCS